jgi:integrase
MRAQKGYIFHRYSSWFVRYCDDVRQPDGTIKRKLVCKKLGVEYGGQYHSKASVKTFVQELLAPVNSGLLNPQSTMALETFVETVYFHYVVENLRNCTVKGYRHLWERHLKGRIGKIALRDFRTVHGEKLLSDVALQTQLGKNSLKHIKAFMSGVFKQAKRLGVLDGLNPMQDTSIPRTPAADETYAYSLDELKKILLVLEEPSRTVVLTAALTGLRKSELRGLRWQDFNGKELSVKRSFVNGETNDTKNARSKAVVPVVRMLADALNKIREGMGILATSESPIFQAGNGKPLNLDNLARRVIAPALEGTGVVWHGWHAWRRGLATTLHQLGIDDKTIQTILRHSNIGVTMNIYVKSVAESQVNAMDTLSAEMQNSEVCNGLATQHNGPIN